MGGLTQSHEREMQMSESPRFAAHLSCGDTVSATVEPKIGAYRTCIHCDSKKKVVSFNEYPVQSLPFHPEPWHKGLSELELTALSRELDKAYRVIAKLENYEYRKYQGNARIDYSFGHELVELMCDIVKAC